MLISAEIAVNVYCNALMILGIFTWLGCFDTIEVKFTCMATWVPYKIACELLKN